jgi:hypothetical protein
MAISRSQLPKEIDGKLRGARKAKRGLWANINRRKKLGISRPKSQSTISPKAYANMKAGFPKKESAYMGKFIDVKLDGVKHSNKSKKNYYGDLLK